MWRSWQQPMKLTKIKQSYISLEIRDNQLSLSTRHPWTLVFSVQVWRQNVFSSAGQQPKEPWELFFNAMSHESCLRNLSVKDGTAWKSQTKASKHLNSLFFPAAEDCQCHNLHTTRDIDLSMNRWTLQKPKPMKSTNPHPDFLTC